MLMEMLESNVKHLDQNSKIGLVINARNFNTNHEGQHEEAFGANAQKQP